jgi:hypothetical protein
MHRLVKFVPINIQEADGPVIYGQDPEQKIDTVCHRCNNEWMSRIEDKSKTRLESMLLNKPISIDPGGMKLLTEWAVLRSVSGQYRIMSKFSPTKRLNPPNE